MTRRAHLRFCGLIRRALPVVALPFWLVGEGHTSGTEPEEAAATPQAAGTLRLSDIFTGAPIPERPGSWDPAGPVLFFPDTAHWRLPPPEPTPTPEPFPQIPEGFDIPYLPPLIAADDPFRDHTGRPAFNFRGLSPGSMEEGHALVRVETTHSQLRSEYRLVPVPAEEGEDGSSAEPLVFLHAPRTSEEFAVPEGRYRLERRLWRADFPQHHRREVYDVQRLEARGIYEFSTARDPESRWMTELRRPPLRRTDPGEPLPPAGEWFSGDGAE